MPLSPCALLAQLDRAFGYGPKGQGFESLTARNKTQGVILESFILYYRQKKGSKKKWHIMKVPIA